MKVEMFASNHEDREGEETSRQRKEQEWELIQTCVRERYDSPVLCIEIAQRVGLWGQKTVLEGLLRPGGGCHAPACLRHTL